MNSYNNQGYAYNAGQNQQQANLFQAQPTGYQFGAQVQQPQATGWGIQPQMMSQQTGYQTQPQNQQQQPIGVQQTGFQPRTSFGQKLQAQVTGWQAPQQQETPPQSGFQAQPQTSFQAQPQNGFQAPPQTSFQAQPQMQFKPLMAQPTGVFIRSLNETSTQPKKNTELKIPNIRLSFISARDQERFQGIFRQNIRAGENAVDGSTARQILMRSNLDASTLAQIWELCDTNKSGKLLFPEFALALYLCNRAIRGDAVPSALPSKVHNEVTSFVDTINFGVPDSQEREDSQNGIGSQNGFAPQTTGFAPQTTGFAPQTTGFAPQTTGFAPQTTGFAPQTTGYGAQPPVTFNSQPTGVAGQPKPLALQPTGVQVSPQALNLQPTGVQVQQTGFGMPPQTSFVAQPTGGYGLGVQPTGLVAQPTGKPGQWGFVSMPTGNLPGLDMMKTQFMPNATQANYNMAASMGGTRASNVTWAITKPEKQIYDNIFRKWDTEKNGYVSGEVAISVFGKSGLSRSDLESIWNLADIGNKGKLDKDEFSVAMHLIYRRLNGFDIPTQLPPELVPPSSRLLQETMHAMKNQLKDGSGNGKSAAGTSAGSVSAASFRNNDDDIEYVSSARHRSYRQPKNEDEEDLEESGQKSGEKPRQKSVLDRLRKQIREKKILLDSADAQDEDRQREMDSDMREINSLKEQIQNLQTRIEDSASGTSAEEKRKLMQRLQKSFGQVPSLVDEIRRVADQVSATKLELYRCKLQKSNPTGISIKGTGPNGEVTNRDRRIAKQKALIQARMARLTGRPAPNIDAFESNEEKLEQESKKARQEAEETTGAVQDIDASIGEMVKDIQSSLSVSNTSEAGYRKWELAEGVVSGAVRSFIGQLNGARRQMPHNAASSNVPPQNAAVSSGLATISGAVQQARSNVEDRAKRIKEKAEKRMRDRLAKLGIRTRREDEAVKVEEVEEVGKAASEAVPNAVPKTVPKAALKTAPKAALQQPKPSTPPQHAAVEPIETAEEDEDEEDEEIKALLAQKKALEEKEKEHKRKKQERRARRIAELKAQMEALRKEEADDSSEDEVPVKKETRPVAPPPVPASRVVSGSSKAGSAEKAAGNAEKAAGGVPAINNNPFAHMAKAEPAQKAGEKAEKPEKAEKSKAEVMRNNNPFFKSAHKGPEIDTQKLEAQRAAQRGLGDDGWSDEEESKGENEDSDDEIPSSSKQAALADMLFGGGSRQNSVKTDDEKGRSGSDKAEEKKEEEKSELTGQATSQEETEDEWADAASKAPSSGVSGENTQEGSREGSAPAEIPPAPPIPEVSAPVAPPIPEGSVPEASAPVPPPVPQTSAPLPPPVPQSSAPILPPVPQSSAPIPPPVPQASAPAKNSSAEIPQNTIGALLGEINVGTKLRKVDKSQQHITTGATVGRVL
ncbi:hypothetical protein BRETT_002459 [Brettanomyces bruxellensis]|uniref:Actin cytoskeleton-regulatory complex protein PAN1 n=1 Tax=Dekkera bruxellensis TaxID=5007 RepID=A0A871RDV0_DEKBR|nr:uncharacterized protein BRETT_002459 [Brettanomyces bruxellensis]QOU22285.1 hypothetical protein BRETT_002459 [Brettanomyces bruxellensis]